MAFSENINFRAINKGDFFFGLQHKTNKIFFCSIKRRKHEISPSTFSLYFYMFRELEILFF